MSPFKRLALFLCVALWCLVGFLLPLPALASVPTVPYSDGVETVAVPDIADLKFSALGTIGRAGWIQVPAAAADALGYDPSRSWADNTPIENVLMLGDLSGTFGLEAFSLQNIAEIAGIDPANLKLGDFGLSKYQTLSSLVQAIPGLENLPIGSIAPFASLLGSIGRGDIAGTVGEVLDRFPEIADLGLDRIDLGSFGVLSVPGLVFTPMSELAKWGQGLIGEIPGLKDVPFDLFPLAPGTELQLVARADVVFGKKERGDPSVGADRFVSGSGKKGKTVPVACEAGTPCAYLELTDLLPGGSMKGKRWASGETQQVSGGEGILASVNGGKEPTGVVTFLSGIFKQAIVKTDEASGTADFGLYLRVCVKTAFIDLGCTPYFIGPIPWLPVKEKGLVVLLSSKDPAVKVPKRYQDQIDAIIARYGPRTPDPATDNGLGNTSLQGGSPCTDAIVNAVPASWRNAASNSVPLLIEEGKKAGLTPDQMAYVLGTIETESGFGYFSSEIGRGQGKAYGNWYGRGLVQITWDYNYKYWSNRLGVDLMANPDLAARPDIATKIAVYGMRDGTYTAVSRDGTFSGNSRNRLSTYINGDKVDYVGARAIVNGNDKAAQIAARARRYQQVLRKSCTNPDNPSSLANRSPDGSANSKILDSIEKMRGFSTRDIPGTAGGSVACAAAVNRVLENAGYGRLGGGGWLSVLEVEKDLRSGRGQAIDAARTKAGDIVIVADSEIPGGKQHIGFCLNDGCTKTISNSSSRASFSWVSDGKFSPSYQGRRVSHYRVIK